ncbi:exosortase system-associated protein, TIGR04073 family [Desulfovibrio sp. JC022]|uniref:exosortase system-associated protein, TIGR04073 family n=1 Tax=Desulfovibrio sp. JC022 TaxID=2593642 RepID=UPI0013D148D2|nr:exosortase system-associated protein, TIGR04073 family [Desulfovibrio sp. JC022]NDV24479.1 exosortase system-associated protein, TIGR04073 family [Desulfovibrio sp. JC022]
MIESKRFIKILLIAVALSSMLLGGCSLNSANYVGNEENYSDRAPRKLGRGMTNILTAPLEIPNQAVDLAAENDEPAQQAAGYVGGFFVGVAYAGGRVVSGMYDIVTSPFGGPSVPTMDPDLIKSDFCAKVEKRDESFKDVTGIGAE